MEGKKRGGGLGFGGFVVKTGSGLVAKGGEARPGMTLGNDTVWLR